MPTPSPEPAAVSAISSAVPGPDTGLRRVLGTWWPLAASWLLMSLELPAVSAAMARLPDPRIHLAAYGGVVFPLAMMVEAPIIMLLAASTALAKDWVSYVKLRRFMFAAAGALTVVHVLVAATPLFDFVVGRLIGAPEEIRGPARVGLLILTPWTASIAYRRFQQGVLIRFGHSRVVGAGTLVRLSANLIVIALGFAVGHLSGIVVGASAVAAGVMSEAVFVGFRVRPVLRNKVRPAPAVVPGLSLGGFLAFYIPLALTSVIALLTMPITAAGLARLPLPLPSLAAWPVVGGLLFLLRSLGIGFNEVVVALLDEPGLRRTLERFALVMGVAVTVAIAVVVATPLGELWFHRVSGLSPDLTHLARGAAWFGLLLPALGFAQSWYQGNLVHFRRTRGITESVALYLIVIAVVMVVAVRLNPTWPGLYIGIAASAVAAVAQNLWLRFRAEGARREAGNL